MYFFAPLHCPHHHMCIATKSKVCHEPKSRGDTVWLLTHQDSHLLLAKEPAKHAGESEPHPGNLKQSIRGAVAQLGHSLMTIAEGLVWQAGPPLLKDDHFQKSPEKPYKVCITNPQQNLLAHFFRPRSLHPV